MKSRLLTNPQLSIEMSTFRKFLFIAVLSISIFSCGDTTNNKLIIGSWQASEWLVRGEPSESNSNGTSFTFNDKGEYTFTHSGNIEKGTYKVENDMLFTTPDKENEMMVKIDKLTKDSLVFGMNRGGVEEVLTLVRK